MGQKLVLATQSCGSEAGQKVSIAATTCGSPFTHACSDEPCHPHELCMCEETAAELRMLAYSVPAEGEVHTLPGYDRGPAEDEWPPGGQRSLVVPAEFKQVQRAQNDDQKDLLESCLKSFARSLFHGIHVPLLLNDGQTVLVECSLNLNMTHFVMRGKANEKQVALATVKGVRGPPSQAECAKSPVATLDSCCAMMLLLGGEFLTFRFETEQACTFFTTCMKVLVKAGRKMDQDSLKKA